MIIHMDYADETITEEHKKIIIYDNDDEPICEIEEGKVTVYGMDDHYSESPSETFDHIKVFPLLPGKDF